MLLVKKGILLLVVSFAYCSGLVHFLHGFTEADDKHSDFAPAFTTTRYQALVVFALEEKSLLPV